MNYRIGSLSTEYSGGIWPPTLVPTKPISLDILGDPNDVGRGRRGLGLKRHERDFVQLIKAGTELRNGLGQPNLRLKLAGCGYC